MIPQKLKERLERIGLDESIYDIHSRKCIITKGNLQLEKVPWFHHAYYINNAKNYGNYFILDPISIVPVLELNPKPNEQILDMCAAPGGKTFLINFMTSGKANFTANDIDKNRIKRLKYNVKKFSINAFIENRSGRLIKGEFDKILVDAPCSSEGIINKKEKVFHSWSEKRVKLFAKKQKKLVSHAFSILKPGGLLVYCTCTFEPDENEKIVEHLLKNDNIDIEPIKTKIRYSPPITNSDNKLKNCMRIYPQDNNTNGFFIAKIRRIE